MAMPKVDATPYLPGIYQHIIDCAGALSTYIMCVLRNDAEALGVRASASLGHAADMAAYAAWVATDRRDALCPDAADETIVTKGGVE